MKTKHIVCAALCAIVFRVVPETVAQIVDIRQITVTPEAPEPETPARNTASDAEPQEETTTVTTTTVVQQTVTTKSSTPPTTTQPPPEPPARDAAEPKRLVRYFCKAWKDEEYEKMYWAMSKDYRKSQTLEAFTALFENDKQTNGGLKDENIPGKEEEINAETQLTVKLTFRNARVKPRTVKARAVKTPDGFRLTNSGILPVDLENL